MSADFAAALTRVAIDAASRNLTAAYPGATAGVNTGVCDEVERRFVEWALTAWSACPHVTGGQPQAYWAPSARQVMCTRCMQSVMAAMRGTYEDSTCDFCRTKVGEKEPMGYGMAVIGAQATGAVVWPPITIPFGACKPCINRYAR